MRVDIDFKYGEPVVADIYSDCGDKFMKSEVKVKIPKKPNDDCTEAKYLKWKEKTLDKINQAVLKSLSKELYGEVEVNINMEKHHGL